MKSNKNKRKNQAPYYVKICGKNNHSTAVCYHMYDYYGPEDEVPQALAAMNIEDPTDQQFYADLGATAYMTNTIGNLVQYSLYVGYDKIYVGDGKGLLISHIGNTILKTPHGNLKLNNDLVVPHLKKNLLSVVELTSSSKCSFEFNSNGFIVKNKENQVLAKGGTKGNFYALEEVHAAAVSAINKRKL